MKSRKAKLESRKLKMELGRAAWQGTNASSEVVDGRYESTLR
jgi:hypothetical protein